MAHMALFERAPTRISARFGALFETCRVIRMTSFAPRFSNFSSYSPQGHHYDPLVTLDTLGPDRPLLKNPHIEQLYWIAVKKFCKIL